VKIIPIKKLSFDFDTILQETSEENEIVEETPIKEDENGNDMLPADIMAREIQRLSLRLRSSTPCKISIIQFNIHFLLLSKCTMFPFSIINQVNQQLFIFLK
jgi:hypothetical protein